MASPASCTLEPDASSSSDPFLSVYGWRIDNRDHAIRELT
jgi:hypothetical protein